MKPSTAARRPYSPRRVTRSAQRRPAGLGPAEGSSALRAGPLRLRWLRWLHWQSAGTRGSAARRGGEGPQRALRGGGNSNSAPCDCQSLQPGAPGRRDDDAPGRSPERPGATLPAAAATPATPLVVGPGNMRGSYGNVRFTGRPLRGQGGPPRRRRHPPPCWSGRDVAASLPKYDDVDEKLTGLDARAATSCPRCRRFLGTRRLPSHWIRRRILSAPFAAGHVAASAAARPSPRFSVAGLRLREVLDGGAAHQLRVLAALAVRRSASSTRPNPLSGQCVARRGVAWPAWRRVKAG